MMLSLEVAAFDCLHLDLPQLRIFYAYSESLQGEFSLDRATSTEEPYNLLNSLYMFSRQEEMEWVKDLPMLIQFNADEGAFGYIGGVAFESGETGDVVM